ncbi:MAG: Mur ligase domain-containing protein, partial [Gemmatimonadota bacterium]|nr:Mur ligase domain-containing protein [Gemmatimonadota bacterium]
MSTGFWTLDRIAAALDNHSTGSAPRGSTQVRGITTDTRKIGKGDVFLALKGERFDGHDYLRDAVRDGASAIIASRVPKLGSLGVP